MCLCIHDTCSRVCVCLFTACCTTGRFVCIWWIMHRHIETDSIGVRKRNSRLYSYALLCSGGLVFVVVDLNGSSVWRCIYVCVCCRCLGPMHSVVDIRLALWPIGDALHTHSYRIVWLCLCGRRSMRLECFARHNGTRCGLTLFLSHGRCSLRSFVLVVRALFRHVRPPHYGHVSLAFEEYALISLLLLLLLLLVCFLFFHYILTACGVRQNDSTVHMSKHSPK